MPTEKLKENEFRFTQNNERKILEKIFYLIAILTAIIAPIITLRERVIRIETQLATMQKTVEAQGAMLYKIERFIDPPENRK